MIGVDLAGSYPSWLTDRLAAGWRAVVESWPLPAYLAAALAVLALIARTAYVRAWRSAVTAGYWVRIDPPASPGPLQAGRVWRLLEPLAELAHGRWWRLVRLPLALEIHCHAGRLAAYLRLPGHVPVRAAVAKAASAWPGAAIVPHASPGELGGGGAGPVMAGYRLASRVPDTGPLVDDRPARAARGDPGYEPLSAVLEAMAREQRCTVVQILVRPVPARRRDALRAAATHPATPRGSPVFTAVDKLGDGVLAVTREVVDIATPGTTSTPTEQRHTARPAPAEPDPLAVAGMREAAEKWRDRPHLLAAIRVAATGPTRSIARAAARDVADGYRQASAVLRPVRLHRALQRMAERRAGRAEWLLVTAAELGVLAHLPADPGLYGFTTAARHRPPPPDAAHGWSTYDPPESTYDRRNGDALN